MIKPFSASILFIMQTEVYLKDLDNIVLSKMQIIKTTWTLGKKGTEIVIMRQQLDICLTTVIIQTSVNTIWWLQLLQPSKDNIACNKYPDQEQMALLLPNFLLGQPPVKKNPEIDITYQLQVHVMNRMSFCGYVVPWCHQSNHEPLQPADS